MVGQHDGGFARTQGFDDLFHALDVGGGGAAFAAHAPGLHDGIEGFDFRRFVHGGQREGKLLADVASGQVVAAEVWGNQQQAFASVQRGLDVLPAVHFAKQGFDVFRPSEKGHGQFQRTFGGFAQYFFNGGIVRRQPGNLQVFADAGAVFVQQVKGEAAPETGHGVQAFQRQGGKDAAEEED